MTIAALSHYKPFSATQDVFQDCIVKERDDIDKRIEGIVLFILWIVPALILDFILSAASLVRKIVSWISAPDPEPGHPHFEIQRDPPRVARDNASFFEEAVTAGFSSLDAQRIEIYKELIRTDGVLDEGEVPVDIYKWVSECLVIHHLRSRNDFPHVERLFPRTGLENTIDPIWDHFQELHWDSRGKVFFKIIDKNFEPALTADERAFLHAIQASSDAIARSVTFRQLWPMLQRNI